MFPYCKVDCQTYFALPFPLLLGLDFDSFSTLVALEVEIILSERLTNHPINHNLGTEVVTDKPFTGGPFWFLFFFVDFRNNIIQKFK